MDLMDIRRGLMGQMVQGDALPNGWKKTSITCTTSIRNGSELDNFLSSVLSNCKYAFGLLDRDLDTAPTVNNTVTAFIWNENGVKSGYQRYRNSNYGCIANFGSNYDAVVIAGNTFTVIYVE